MSIVIDSSKLKQAAFARHRGEKPDWVRIRELLVCGWSMHEIAKELGCSTWPVQKVRKELKNYGFGSFINQKRKPKSKKGIKNGQNTKVESSEQAIRLPIGAGQNYQDSRNDNHQRQRGEEHLG